LAIVGLVPDGGTILRVLSGDTASRPLLGRRISTSPSGLFAFSGSFNNTIYVNGVALNTSAYCSNWEIAGISADLVGAIRANGNCGFIGYVYCAGATLSVLDVAVSAPNEDVLYVASLNATGNNCNLAIGDPSPLSLDAGLIVTRTNRNGAYLAHAAFDGTFGPARILARGASIYLAGSLRGSSTALGITGPADYDIFVASLNSQLVPNLATVSLIRGAGDETVHELSIAPDGTLWLAGEHGDAGTFLMQLSATLAQLFEAPLNVTPRAQVKGLAHDLAGDPLIAGICDGGETVDFNLDGGAQIARTPSGVSTLFFGRPRLR